jgi:hypothetical protein
MRTRQSGRSFMSMSHILRMWKTAIFTLVTGRPDKVLRFRHGMRFLAIPPTISNALQLGTRLPQSRTSFMKSSKVIITSMALGLAHVSVLAQGTFQNLNFEQANPVFVSGPDSPYDATTASALPGWTVLIGGVQQSVVTVNNPTLGAPWVSLVGPGTHFGFSPIDGDYSVLLQGYAGTVAISQTGLIPSGTQSLLFESATGLLQPGLLEVSVGTQDVPLVAVGTGPNYTLYGANISAWAGQTDALTFSAAPGGAFINNWELDDISFSPNAVTPEPSPLVLTGFGGLLFALCRRFAPKRPSR